MSSKSKRFPYDRVGGLELLSMRVLYFQATAQDLADDQDKILFTYSLMQKGAAQEFVHNFEAERQANIWDWNTFIQALNQCFLSPNIAKNALNKLTKIKQKQKDAHTFLVKMCDLFRKANISDESTRIHLIEQAINPDIILQIAYSGDVPTTAETYVARIVKIDGHLQRIKSKTKPSGSNSDRRDGTGTTFGGQGQPMDIGAMGQGGNRPR